jgi:hypothetical protein
MIETEQVRVVLTPKTEYIFPLRRVQFESGKNLQARHMRQVRYDPWPEGAKPEQASRGQLN